MEEWRDIVGYEGIYAISNKGRVKNVTTGRILSPQDNGKGYFKIALSKGQSERKHYIHRLIAEAFIPNPLGKKEVNHIDSNPSNNTISNLEWVSSSENTKHAVYKGALHAWGNKSKPIEAIDIITGASKKFATISEAEREIGSRHITDVLKGKRHQCKGYYFRYLKGGDACADFEYISTKREAKIIPQG